jgi:hypothetical protein
MKVYDGTAWQLAYVPAGDFVTGAASSATNAMVLFDGTTGKLVKQGSVGTVGQVLVSNGPNNVPTFQDAVAAFSIGKAYFFSGF